MQELDKLTCLEIFCFQELRNSNIVILTAIMLEEMCFSKHFVKGMLSSDFFACNIPENYQPFGCFKI